MAKLKLNLLGDNHESVVHGKPTKKQEKILDKYGIFSVEDESCEHGRFWYDSLRFNDDTFLDDYLDSLSAVVCCLIFRCPKERWEVVVEGYRGTDKSLWQALEDALRAWNAAGRPVAGTTLQKALEI